MLSKFISLLCTVINNNIPINFMIIERVHSIPIRYFLLEKNMILCLKLLYLSKMQIPQVRGRIGNCFDYSEKHGSQFVILVTVTHIEKAIFM